MQIITEPAEMQKLALDLRRQGRTIGFVPTMGCLHEGHLSLIHIAAARTDTVVVSIFVNPTQFGPQEDLEKYPRPFTADRDVCEKNGVEILFHPDPGAIYPSGFSTWVNEEKLSSGLCGSRRPGHFRGVTTVVAKLFNLVQPHVAVFGKKDAQQVLVIRRMARDLNMPVEIVLAPTVREADGLAMSSRNRYLSAADRQRALALHQGLQAAAVLFVAGERQSSRLTAAVADSVIAAGGSIDYVELVNTVELQPVQDLVGDAAILAVAAFFGGTRLIDNIFLSPETT